MIEPEIITSLDGRKVTLKGGWQDSFRPIIKERCPKVIALVSGDWSNLHFLSDLSGCYKSLYIGDESADSDVVSNLSSLERLEVGGWFKAPLSFKKLSKFYQDTHSYTASYLLALNTPLPQKCGVRR